MTTVSGVTVSERLQSVGSALTATERRIADVLLSSPQVVAFGTVADVAAAASAGTATVVRLATKLDYEGFAALQRDIQSELAQQLRPAAERIRELGNDDLVARHTAAEEGNVAGTLAAVDEAALRAVIALLADRHRPVRILSGSASRGVANQFEHDLMHLRPDVAAIAGSQVDVLQAIALGDADTVIVALDLRRYERWLVDALQVAHDRGHAVIALTDSVLSPLAAIASHSFVLKAASAGPFDSHVGTLALLNLFVAEVAVARRLAATEQLDQLEEVWSANDALID